MFKILFLAFIVGIAASQRSEFVDYVLDLQYAVGFIHDAIQDTTWQSRFEMSAELTEIVQTTMVELTNGLSSFLTMRDRYNSYIEDTRTEQNTECVDKATANWQNVQSDVGAAIGACGGNTMETLHKNVYGFHQFVNSHRQLKFDAQNIVLNAFTKLNPMTNSMDLSPTVEQDINTVFDTFEADVKSGLDERLSAFAQLREEMAPSVHDCIAVALNNFANEAGSIVDAARSC